MIVSAISMSEGLYNSLPFSYNKQIDQIGDTSFNSLSPFTTRKSQQHEKLSKVYENINEWQNFCHNRILGQKLNVIA
ncbi:hypothetical protein IKQ21_07885 [bacterium]|nr:hypothetical protein [bacterium]